MNIGGENAQSDQNENENDENAQSDQNENENENDENAQSDQNENENDENARSESPAAAKWLQWLPPAPSRPNQYKMQFQFLCYLKSQI